MPNGWQDKQIKIIEAYIDAGVDIAVINSMTMCYGTGVYGDEDYGSASVRAMENAINQIKIIYSNRGIELTDDQAYLKMGATISIGYESELYPIFTLDMANKVINDAIDKNYGLVSMWSMNRDAILESNKAISTQYNYTNVLQKYNQDTN